MSAARNHLLTIKSPLTFCVFLLCSESSASSTLSGLWILTTVRNQSSTTNRFSMTSLPHHAIPQITLPATASKIKWFAVAIIATSITLGYNAPMIIQTVLFDSVGNVIFGAKFGCDWLKNGSMIFLFVVGREGRGIVAIVSPMSSE